MSSRVSQCRFFFNDTATTEIYTLSLHDALPICVTPSPATRRARVRKPASMPLRWTLESISVGIGSRAEVEETLRSEEHTSELQSRQYLVCRLLLEKKNEAILYAHSDLP